MCYDDLVTLYMSFYLSIKVHQHRVPLEGLSGKRSGAIY